MTRLKAFLSVFFLFFLGLGLVFWPALSGEKIFNDNYVTNYAPSQTGYNFYKDFAVSLKQGEFQLWWSSYLGGFPVYLTQIGFFNPLGIFLFYSFDYILAYNWLTFLNFLLGALAMYWFLKSLGFSSWASVLGGFVWALSFNNIQYGAIPIFSSLWLFIPLFFLSILKISEGKNIWLIWGIFISAFGLLAGFTNVVFYIFIAGSFFAIFLGYRGTDKNKTLLKRMFGKTFWKYVFFVSIGTILASPWLILVFNYLPLTLRGEAVSSPIFYDYLKVGDILRFFYPFVQLPGFGGISFLSGVANFYVGVLPLVFAIWAMFFWRRNKMIGFWLALFLFAFSMRLSFFPVFQWLQYLPLFSRFRAPFHWYTLAFFSLSVLSAYGLASLEKLGNSRGFRLFTSIFGFFAVLNVFFALVLNLIIKFFRADILERIFEYFDRYVYSSAKKYPLEYYHEVIARVFDQSFWSFSFLNYQFLIPLIFLAIGAGFLVLYQKSYLNFERFKLWAVSSAILNLILIWQGYYNFTSRNLIDSPPDTIQFIQSQANYKKFRVFRFYPPEMYQELKFYEVKNSQDYDFKTLGLQINPYWVDGLGGGEPLRSKRVSEVLDEIGYEIPATYSKPVWIKSNDLTLGQKISRFSSPKNQNLFSMLNIKYIFSSFRLPNLKLVYETTATEKNIPVYIYENPEVLPRVYFAKNVEFIDSNDAFDELLRVKDFRNLTVIECQEECPNENQKSKIKNQNLGNIIIEKFEPQLVWLKTQNGQGQWLIYSDANLPTWEAYIDGQKTQVYTANYLFKSVFVPKGEHEIMFKYPDSWRQFKYALENIF